MTTQPFWLEEPAEPRPRRRLASQPDVVVIGGGVTGCACALVLAEAGLSVRLHEAREVAGGASGRNGGFALRGGAMSYLEARERLGPTAAQLLWRLSERALRRIEELAGDAFRPGGSLRLAADADEAALLEREHDALRADGFEVERVARLSPPLAGRYRLGLLHPTDGAIQPARWVRRLASRAATAGAEILERSQVGVDEAAASAVVVAVDGLSAEVLPELRALIRPIRGQMLATAPLPELLYPRPHYARGGFDYWLQDPDRRLLVGGKRDAAVASESTSEERTTSLVQRLLEELASELAGETVEVTHRWAGIWGETPDRLPLVGPVPERAGVWIAGGYSGHGNVLGFACGELVARAILGESAPELALFDPERFTADHELPWA